MFIPMSELELDGIISSVISVASERLDLNLNNAQLRERPSPTFSLPCPLVCRFVHIPPRRQYGYRHISVGRVKFIHVMKDLGRPAAITINKYDISHERYVTHLLLS